MHWRTVLKDQPIFRKLRESQARSKRQSDSRNILALNDGDLFVWDAHKSCIYTSNLKLLLNSGKETPCQVQIYKISDLVVSLSHRLIVDSRYYVIIRHAHHFTLKNTTYNCKFFSIIGLVSISTNRRAIYGELKLIFLRSDFLDHTHTKSHSPWGHWGYSNLLGSECERQLFKHSYYKLHTCPQFHYQ